MIYKPEDFEGWHFDYRPGGWVRARNTTGKTVFLHVVYIGDEGRRRPSIRAAIMDSPETISARSWRGFPFELFDTLLDPEWAPDVYELFTRAAEPHPIDQLKDYFDQTAAEYGYIGAVIPMDEIASRTGNFTPVEDPGGKITDDFLENLAGMYRWAVAAGNAPAPVIAESAGVPASRVHRWVAQARKRGFLPPAIKGKAG